MPGNRDIVAVRSRLEEDLGDTVSRRLAASILGVSHTALARWARAGDLPLVYSSSGREEVPVSALLDLHEAVEQERASGRRHLLEATLSYGRERASRLRVRDLLPSGIDTTGHGRAELLSLAYHRALARRLRQPMIDDALHTLWKWRDQGKVDSHYADRWEEVLRQPVAEVKRIISEDATSARDLRQNSPFAGMLSEAERRKILEEVR